MKLPGKCWLLVMLVLPLTLHTHALAGQSKWLNLDADSKDRIRSLIKSDVESRSGFSTAEEERLNTETVEAEKREKNSTYKAAIDAANSEFQRAKKRSDDLTAQYQTMAYDYEESNKNVENIQASITNIDNQIARYRQDIRVQRNALTKSLKSTKLGEAIVAVIYTRGFMDSAHKLERLADQASAPLIAEHMGTYVHSFSKVINNVLTSDFIRTVQEGTAKWDRKEPFRVAMEKGAKGTTYLRIKRYELYPFQSPEKGHLNKDGGELKAKTALIKSMSDLKTFLAQNQISAKTHDLGAVESMIGDTKTVNQQAKANQREQLISFKERLDYLQNKIAGAQTDRKSMVVILNQKEPRLKKMKAEVEVLKLKKESAESAFKKSHSALLDKKRVHESIIIKTSLVIVKRSETPAEASAEAVIEELKDVLNDARIQHYTSTTDVVDGKLVSEKDNQAITKAKIMAVRPLAFINEGDSIRVKIAFRVRTILDTRKEKLAVEKGGKTIVKPGKDKATTAPSEKPTPIPKRPQPKIAVPEPPKKKATPQVAVKTPPAPPATSTPSAATVTKMDCDFKLEKVSKSAEGLHIFVRATNKAEYEQYFAVYDRTYDYGRSTISGSNFKKAKVHQVYLWQGEEKTASVDAYRGVEVKPGNDVLVELIFKPAPSTKSVVSKFNFIPNVGTRSIIRTYSWQQEEIPFNNIRVP